MSELMFWWLCFLPFGIQFLFIKEVKQTMENMKRKTLCISSDTRWITFVPASSKIGRIWDRGTGIPQTFSLPSGSHCLLEEIIKSYISVHSRLMLSNFNWAFWLVSNHLIHLLLSHNFICYCSYLKLSPFFMFRSLNPTSSRSVHHSACKLSRTSGLFENSFLSVPSGCSCSLDLPSLSANLIHFWGRGSHLPCQGSACAQSHPLILPLWLISSFRTLLSPFWL